jgi:hypothetical protein
MKAPIPSTNSALISFYHPYHREVALLQFRPTEEKGDEYGVHVLTALTACQIVADNAFNGFLSTDQAGEERVDLHPDDVLCNRKYCFHVGKDENGKTIDYAVVPSFDSWTFPSQMPAAWEITRSEKCLISGRSMTEKAPCIPAANEA